MGRDLVFHVGDCKTGSTSIQWALDHRLARPHGRTLLFPGQRSHFPLARSLSQSAEPGLAEKRFAGLRQRLDKGDWDVAVISSELFEFEDPAALAEVIESQLSGCYDNLRLICYVRPHADRLLAQFIEAVKLGHHMGSLEEFHAKVSRGNLLDYAPRLRQWRQVFGNQFEARPYCRDALINGDVVQDFFDWVLGPNTYSLDGNQEQNTRLYLEDLVAFRLLHQQLGENPENADIPAVRFSAWISEILPQVPEDSATPLRLTKQIVAALAAQYGEDAAITDTEFLGGDHLTPSLQAAKRQALETTQSLEPQKVLSPMTIRFLLALIRLQAAQMRNDSSFFHRRAWGGEIV